MNGQSVAYCEGPNEDTRPSGRVSERQIMCPLDPAEELRAWCLGRVRALELPASASRAGHKAYHLALVITEGLGGAAVLESELDGVAVPENV